MQVLHHSAETRRAATEPQYPPLEHVTSPGVSTPAAAYYLNRRPQTLRGWVMTGHPIKPLRVNGRLAWPVADIRRLLGVQA